MIPEPLPHRRFQVDIHIGESLVESIVLTEPIHNIRDHFQHRIQPNHIITSTLL